MQTGFEGLAMQREVIVLLHQGAAEADGRQGQFQGIDHGPGGPIATTGGDGQDYAGFGHRMQGVAAGPAHFVAANRQGTVHGQGQQANLGQALSHGRDPHRRGHGRRR